MPPIPKGSPYTGALKPEEINRRIDQTAPLLNKISLQVGDLAGKMKTFYLFDHVLCKEALSSALENFTIPPEVPLALEKLNVQEVTLEKKLFGSSVKQLRTYP